MDTNTHPKFTKEINGVFIDPQIFTFKFSCMCGGECCNYGVYTDLKEHEMIISIKDKIIPLLDETQIKDVDEWFEEPEEDEDFESGVAVGTEVPNGKCTFLDKNGLCTLQKLAISEGEHKWKYKPIYCVLFPLTVFEGALTIDDEHIDRLKTCSKDPIKVTTIYDACKEELIHFFGEEKFIELENYKNEYLSEYSGVEKEMSKVVESHNKRAIVTGGTRGIGRAIVKELASRSCCGVLFSDVAFVYNSCDECAEELLAEIDHPGIKIHGFKADATSMEQAQATVDAAIEKLGGVDILINNAGITRDNLLLRMSEKEFDDVINANLKSVFNYTKAVIKPMIAQRYGRIVNISSVVGLIGNAGQSNYSASKAGVIGFTKSMARELASRNITVNAIAPGFIQTDMTNKLTEEQVKKLVQNVPMQRLGKPEDIAKVVAFLCSNDADYITGQVIAVDGGMTM